MVDLDKRFREADRIEVRERWAEISARTPRSLPEERPRHRALVIALALVVAGVGIAGAWVALRPSPGPPSAESRESTFTAVWPETSWRDAKMAQRRADLGADQWRLRPVAVAEQFVRTFMRWTSMNSSFQGPHESGAIWVDVVYAPYHGPGPAPMVTVEMRRLVTPGVHGIWSVTKVGSPYLRIGVASGTSVGMRERIPVTALPGRWVTVFGVNPGLTCEAPSGRQSLRVPGPAYPQTRTPRRLTVPVYRDWNPDSCPAARSGPAVLFLVQVPRRGTVGDTLVALPQFGLPSAPALAAVAVHLTHATTEAGTLSSQPGDNA